MAGNSPAQATTSTDIVSSLHTSRDVAPAGPDNETTTKSIYALTITTASVVNSASFIAFVQTTTSSTASHTQLSTVHSEMITTITTVSTVVFHEDPIITLDSNSSSTIRFVDSIGPSVASSSKPDVTSRSSDAQTVAVSSTVYNAIEVSAVETLHPTSAPNQKVSANIYSGALEELTNQISSELNHQPSSGAPNPRQSSYFTVACRVRSLIDCDRPFQYAVHDYRSPFLWFAVAPLCSSTCLLHIQRRSRT